MSSQEPENAQLDLYQEIVPMEYKIVDLPVIQVTPVLPIQQFNCKIYRKVENSDSGLAVAHEWKRKCYGKVKFVEINGQVVVAAYEFGAGHLRMKQIPVLHHKFYFLKASLEYQYNWEFQIPDGEILSICLAEDDFQKFFTIWNSSKTKNSQLLNQQASAQATPTPESACPDPNPLPSLASTSGSPPSSDCSSSLPVPETKSEETVKETKAEVDEDKKEDNNGWKKQEKKEKEQLNKKLSQ